MLPTPHEIELIPVFPFSLCLANESWLRHWDGLDREALMKQEYSMEDDLNHIRYLLEVFKDPRSIHLDAAVEFQPDWSFMPNPIGRSGFQPFLDRLIRKRNPYAVHTIHKYEDVVNRMIQKPPATYPRFPGITPTWDNTARRKVGASILDGSSPELYGKWLSHIVRTIDGLHLPENLIFINAWNEWAEGNHLEPDLKWGDAYLKMTAKILGNAAL
jgi:hypothetical protein